ncbi:hypothetical protein [Streptomyces sp. NPDC058953]|uniref:SCO4402 family protein n=1 Tax=unclassified Streptomyces TaxID=2593676 RepID=UPI0036AA6A52
MSGDERVLAYSRVHVVGAVVSLASPSWQRDVWLDPSEFENIDQIFHVLFDDFCDADDPERYLGLSLRTAEEVVLMRRLGAALGAAEREVVVDTDAEYLRSSAWPEVVTIAGRLVQVMVDNDLMVLVRMCEKADPPASKAWGASVRGVFEKVFRARGA